MCSWAQSRPLTGQNPGNAGKHLAGLWAAGRGSNLDFFVLFGFWFLHKTLPAPRIAARGSGSPGNEQGASRSFSRPLSSRPLPRNCWRRRQTRLFPVPKTLSLCLEVPFSVVDHLCHPQRVFPAGLSPPRGRIRWSHWPLPLEPFALLGPKRTFLCFSYQL